LICGSIRKEVDDQPASQSLLKFLNKEKFAERNCSEFYFFTVKLEDLFLIGML
jgi:hypothetical protein